MEKKRKLSNEDIFYKITYNNKVLYIGSTKHFKDRYNHHKQDYINSNSKLHNLPLYKFFTDNNIDFKDINFEIIEKFNLKNETQRFKRERYWIKCYDTFNNGFNDKYPYKTEAEKKETKRKLTNKYKESGKLKEVKKRYNSSEKGKSKNKEYYEANKEEKKKYAKEYYKQKNKM